MEIVKYGSLNEEERTMFIIPFNMNKNILLMSDYVNNK